MDEKDRMTQHITVPNDRIGVIIGQKGSTKRLIEEKGGCELRIDSKTGRIEVYNAKDPLEELRIRDVITAIGRGFSPEKALRLMDEEELTLDIINLSSVAANEKEIKRISSRVIGTNGRMREYIEKMTGCNISVYGKTISIIGNPRGREIAHTGIQMLINGSPHGPVYSFLEKKHREMMEEELLHPTEE